MKNKGLIIGLGIFLVILLGAVVAYLVLKPAPEIKPISTPIPQNTPEPEVPEVNLVDGSNACTLDFVVKPAPSSAPIISCASLTKNKVDSQIKVGTTITFTCAGDTISGEAMGGSSGGDTGNPTFPISYSYRIRKDGGAWEDLISVVSTGPSPVEKAIYTVKSVGSYIVQCRACIVSDGEKICDPIWVETRPD
ncbi:MAG: hypothetical protein ABII80_02440 [bacterium]